MRKRIVVVVLLSAVVWSLAAAADPAPELFSATLDREKLEPLQARRFDEYRKMRSTADMRAANLIAEPSRLESLRLNLFDGELYQAKRTKFEETAGGYVWEGKLDGDGGTASLVVHGSEVTGWVWVSRFKEGDLVYSISSIGGQTHVIRRTDQAWFDSVTPGCITGEKESTRATHVPGAIDVDTDPGAASDVWTPSAAAMLREALVPRTDAAASALGCIVNVLVAYTPAAQAAHGNIPALAQLAVNQTNGSYGNSQVTGLTLNLVGTMPVSYSESGTFTGSHSTDLVRLRNVDGIIDNVHTTRTNLGADIVVLMVNDLDNIGLFGEAWQILATTDTAFAVVDWEAAVDNLTFAHELGHLQGARHHDDPTNSPYQYGHGTCRGWPYKYRTIMATGACNQTRVPYWSNPDVKYNNRKTGDSTDRNNARVLRETACTIGGLQGPALMGWNWLWGNGGSDLIHWWYLNTNDRYVAADFDADGVDELMAVNPNGWSHLMEYAGGSWSTPWGNGGSGSIHWWSIGPADVFVAGDLIPGNFRDELLGIHAAAGYAHVMNYNAGAWSTPWGNGGSGSIHWWALSSADRYLIADFVPGNGRDELLAIQPYSGYAHVMAYNGSGFSTLWANGGNDLIHWWYLNPNDRYLAGDFVPGNGRDELLAVNPNGWAHVMAYNGTAWTTLWSNGGNGAMHWWLIGGLDRYVSADFLPASPGDEVLAIAVNNGWSQMLSFTGSGWQSVWGNSGAGNIGLWYINSPDRYLSGDFASGDSRDELLTIQPVNGWSHLHNRW